MDLCRANALVTGGAGFIGSHLVDALVDAGANVTAIDNLKKGRLENIAGSKDHINFRKIDVRDYNRVKEVVKDQQIIFHLAANASVPTSVSDYCYDFETNAMGTFNILRAAIENKVKKVIFTSSAAVYGEPVYVPTDESHALNPVSPYGSTKMTGEAIGLAYGRTFGIDFTTVRVFNNYGPRQTHYVIYDLLEKLWKDSARLEVLGDGTQVRDYCYVADGVRALLLIAEKDCSRGQVYNLAGGNPIQIRDLVKLIIDVLGLKRVRVEYTGYSWKGDINRLIADITKIRELGFEPEINLRDGIIKMVKWYEKVISKVAF
jgi:UDP-glucose 4-epimerase